jgi:hypothetical protein
MHSELLLSVMACALVAAGSALAQDWRPIWKPDATSPFEVGTQLRPWTIRDEGIDAILDTITLIGEADKGGTGPARLHRVPPPSEVGLGVPVDSLSGRRQGFVPAETNDELKFQFGVRSEFET